MSKMCLIGLFTFFNCSNKIVHLRSVICKVTPLFSVECIFTYSFFLFSHGRFDFGSQQIHSSNLSLMFLISWTFVWSLVWINCQQIRLLRRTSHCHLIQKKPRGCPFICLSHSLPGPCGCLSAQQFIVACVVHYPVSCVHWNSWTDWAVRLTCDLKALSCQYLARKHIPCRS